jgi:DnaJ family protein A protein 2
MRNVIQQQGPFLTQSTVSCDNCSGTGSVFNDKDKCKKCKGKKVTSEKKKLELYIPHGAKNGERIVLAGEADQAPDQEPGDIVFILQEQDHEVYDRRGNDLVAEVTITLAEALCGFSRVVIKTLDGRGLHVDHQKPANGVLKPGSTIKIPGEGMPIKRTDAKGDLYLVVDVEFPSDDDLQDKSATESIQKILPGPAAPIEVEHVDEVSHEAKENLEEFGGAANPQEWEDEDEDEEGVHGAQCAQQ